MLNREAFYRALRNKSGIPGFLIISQDQVDGIEAVLDAFESTGDGSIKTLAYALATVYKEVGQKMLPVREGFKKTDKEARAFVLRLYKASGGTRYQYAIPVNGHVYYGRGYPQLTWFVNYEAEGIADNPDKALEPKWSAELLFRGLQDGRWNARGKGISFYLPPEGPDDLMNARRTINVTDDWEEVADLYKKFLLVIVQAGGI